MLTGSMFDFVTNETNEPNPDRIGVVSANDGAELTHRNKTKMNKTTSTLLTLSLVTAAWSVRADEKFDFSKLDTSKLPPPATQKGLTYAKDIRPMLEASCFRCHGEERPKGGLRLDSLEAALKGGEDGKIIVAGKSKESPLVIAAAQIDD